MKAPLAMKVAVLKVRPSLRREAALVAEMIFFHALSVERRWDELDFSDDEKISMAAEYAASEVAYRFH